MNKYDITLNEEQAAALSILESGANVFLTGSAGTGKSLVIKAFCERNKHKNIVLCAPTGMAAINIEGVTLHRLFNLKAQQIIKPGDYLKYSNMALKDADAIIIDEISMCRIDLFEYVMRSIKEAVHQSYRRRGKQIIVVGDFYQLPPVFAPKDQKFMASVWNVYSEEEIFPFKSDLWKEANFKNIVLRKVERQTDCVENQEYKENLNKIRTGDNAAMRWFNEHTSRLCQTNSIYLCGRNKTADNFNSRCISELKTEERHYYSEQEGDVTRKDKIVPDDLLLKIGMKVMIVVNDPMFEYQNGSMGIVESFSDDEVKIELNTGRVVTVRRFEWNVYSYFSEGGNFTKKTVGTYRQFPIKPGYAVTIHKAQGQTYDAVCLYPECYASGQLYVGLSRVRDFSDLVLQGDIGFEALKTSKSVVDFYNQLVEEPLDNPTLSEVVVSLDSTDEEADKMFTEAAAYEEVFVAPIPETSEERKYYIAKDGEPQGPYSFSQLKSMAERNELLLDSLVWNIGDPGWTYVSDIDELSNAYLDNLRFPPMPA